MKTFQVGQTVNVSGYLPWGDWKGSRVSTEGVIEEIRRTGMLVNLDYVDGDYGVCTLIPKKLCEIINGP